MGRKYQEKFHTTQAQLILSGTHTMMTPAVTGIYLPPWAHTNVMRVLWLAFVNPHVSTYSLFFLKKIMMITQTKPNKKKEKKEVAVLILKRGV